MHRVFILGGLFGFLKTRCLIAGVSDTAKLCQTLSTQLVVSGTGFGAVFWHSL